MRRSNIVLAVLGFFFGLSLVIVWFSPRLVSWTPEGELVTANSRVGMIFSRPIDAEKAADHLNISPHIDGEVTAEGNTIWFKPDGVFRYGQKYSFALDRGLFLLDTLLPIGSYEKQLDVNSPELVYLKDEGGRSNLWKHRSEDSPVMLTDEATGVWGYEVVPGGRDLLISSMDSDGSDDLVVITEGGSRDILLECVEYRCRDAHWQPAGNLVAYERQSLNALDASSEVWILDTENRSTRPVYSAELAAETGFSSLNSRNPRWSADGQNLAYYKPDARVIIIQPMSAEQPTLISANLDLMGEWSPDKNQLAYTELVLPDREISGEEEGSSEAVTRPGDDLASHLVIADITTGEVVDLNIDDGYSDGFPAWNPKGDMIAVGREGTGGGRQLWVVDAAGQLWTQLTEDPMHNYSSPAWSPDGEVLALMRHNLVQGSSQSGVWLLEAKRSVISEIAEKAYLPGWLP